MASKRMEYCLIAVTILIIGTCHAQNTAPLRTNKQVAQDSIRVLQDSTLKEEKKPFNKELAIYFDQNVEIDPQYGGYGLSSQTGFGLSFQGFSTGFFVSKSKGRISKDPFFPRDYSLPNRHAGVFIGKSLFRKPKTDLYFRLNAGAGDLAWKDEETGSQTFNDRFYLIKPELRFSYLPTNFLQLHLSGGYRHMEDLQLTQINPSDYSGFTFNIGLSLGYFHKPKNQ